MSSRIIIIIDEPKTIGIFIAMSSLKSNSLRPIRYKDLIKLRALL